MARHYDLIVIGSGPVSRRAVVQAATLKKSVLVIERGRRAGGVPSPRSRGGVAERPRCSAYFRAPQQRPG
jgi:thioredoxin reductase